MGRRLLDAVSKAVIRGNGNKHLFWPLNVVGSFTVHAMVHGFSSCFTLQSVSETGRSSPVGQLPMEAGYLPRFSVGMNRFIIPPSFACYRHLANSRPICVPIREVNFYFWPPSSHLISPATSLFPQRQDGEPKPIWGLWGSQVQHQQKHRRASTCQTFFYRTQCLDRSQ